jgi:S1-C subfamily serine protease
MWVAALTLLFALQPAHAQQMQRFGDYELHYIVIPTTMLKPDIAARYNIRRGKDRALCNISVIDNNGVGVKAALEGSSQNLLGQRQGLTFTEVGGRRRHLLSGYDSSRQ